MRNFAAAYETGYFPLIHCGTSYGHYKEVREELLFGPRNLGHDEATFDANERFEPYYNDKIFVVPAAGGSPRVITHQTPHEVTEADADAVADEDEDEDEALPDDADDGPDLVRVHLLPTEAQDFVAGAVAVMQAGRPPCPNCGEPLDATGHFCARRNGYTN